MRIVGVIAEYNPFHNGHAWHLTQARRLSGCDAVVAVMAGELTQRGEVAIVDKWSRARMALACGADVVLELPALFAVRSADWFARGGVGILGGLGVDCLSFGCEEPALKRLPELSRLQTTEAFAELLREELGKGFSHARARGEALARLSGMEAEAINQPNTALALEYIRENTRLVRPMEIVPVPRQGAYHDTRMGTLASATAIRAAFWRGESVREAAPQAAQPILEEALSWAARTEALDAALFYRLRSMETEELAALCDVSEGLENRIARLCRRAGTREELLDGLKCKRYTRARLGRLLAYALLGLTREFADAHPEPSYARVLGFRRDKKDILGRLQQRASLPLAVDPVRLKGDPVFALERRATDLRALCAGLPADRDFTERMVIADR